MIRLLTIRKPHSYTANLTAYNLTIDGVHTYYAGATPVLVHNSCSDGAAEGEAANEGEPWVGPDVEIRAETAAGLTGMFDR